MNPGHCGWDSDSAATRPWTQTRLVDHDIKAVVLCGTSVLINVIARISYKNTHSKNTCVNELHYLAIIDL